LQAVGRRHVRLQVRVEVTGRALKGRAQQAGQQHCLAAVGVTDYHSKKQKKTPAIGTDIGGNKQAVNEKKTPA